MSCGQWRMLIVMSIDLRVGGGMSDGDGEKGGRLDREREWWVWERRDHGMSSRRMRRSEGRKEGSERIR